MIIGTSYFPSKAKALRYYAYESATMADIERKLDEGLIHIGAPPLKAGKERWCFVDSGLRYGIETSD
jgi:hypothetical protein